MSPKLSRTFTLRSLLPACHPFFSQIQASLQVYVPFIKLLSNKHFKPRNIVLTLQEFKFKHAPRACASQRNALTYRPHKHKDYIAFASKLNVLHWSLIKIMMSGPWGIIKRKNCKNTKLIFHMLHPCGRVNDPLKSRSGKSSGLHI